MPITITMPALSPTMTEGNLATWTVKEGDTVAAGDVIAEIETDKATMEVEAVDEGTIAKILVPGGTEAVAVNAPIAILAEEGEDVAAAAASAPAAAPVGGAAPAPAPAEEAAPAPAAAPSAAPAPAAAVPAVSGPAPAAPVVDGKRVFSTPLARRIAADNGLDIAKVTGSGPHGRVVKADVEAAIASGAAAPAAEATPAPAAAAAPAPAPVAAPGEPEYELVKVNNMRKTIARRLTEAKSTIPHFYLEVDVTLDALLKLRSQLNKAADGAYKLSVNDFVVKASALALKKVPAANASWSDEGVKMYKSADVAVAVAIDGGLITPIVKHAEAKGLQTISDEVKDLAGRAKDGKLMPEEYQGGSFSISNLGMFGIKSFSAVINPPHGAILAVGAGEQRAVVVDGAVQIATQMSCTLSCDHRVVDGAVAAQFLAAFKDYVENPLKLML